MKKFLTILFILIFFGCDENPENCETTISCEDDVEMVCDQPTKEEFENGDSVTVTACTYITYEHCFEKTVCKTE